MKKALLTLLVVFISYASFSQESENTKINSLFVKLNELQEEIDTLKDSIQNEILKNGYPIKAKKKYSFSKLKLVDDEYSSNILDTINENDVITILDKTISYFKVKYNKKIGYIYMSDLYTSDYPILDYLLPPYSRKSYSYSSSSNSSYSTGRSGGGSVQVKGYYRKNGTYVKPHTRSSPSRSSGRRR